MRLTDDSVLWGPPIYVEQALPATNDLSQPLVFFSGYKAVQVTAVRYTFTASAAVGNRRLRIAMRGSTGNGIQFINSTNVAAGVLKEAMFTNAVPFGPSVGITIQTCIAFPVMREPQALEVGAYLQLAGDAVSEGTVWFTAWLR